MRLVGAVGRAPQPSHDRVTLVLSTVLAPALEDANRAFDWCVGGRLGRRVRSL
jgi:hypothetical protein